MALERVDARVFRSGSAADTERLGELVAPCLAEGDVLVLTGGLGAGKTQFPVTSPTFALMAVHDGGSLPLFHFDLYRLEHAYELEDTGIFDVLGYEGVCLLEWGEQFQDELTDAYLSVTITRLGEDERALEFVGHGARSRALADAIDHAVAEALG